MLDDAAAGDIHDRNQRVRKAARRAEEEFTKAAVGSIPKICKYSDAELFGDLAGMFSCVEALQGLIEDMEDVTLTRDMEGNDWGNVMGGSKEESNNDSELIISHSRIGLRQLIKKLRAKAQTHGPAKWYERLAAKVLAVGVNYVQGWILLQALRREARRRDLEMPKFPLF